MTPSALAVYCGVWPGQFAGHYDCLPGGKRIQALTPWADEYAGLDGAVPELLAGVPPHSAGFWGAIRDAPEHRWRVWHRRGMVHAGAHEALDDWTLLAAWDRTGDNRAGSYSAFVLPGTLDVAQAIAEARHLFPTVWARIDAAQGRP